MVPTKISLPNGGQNQKKRTGWGMSGVSGKAHGAICLVLMLGTGFSSAAWAAVSIGDAVQIATGSDKLLPAIKGGP